MIYFDTNVLIYSVVEQDILKTKISQHLISHAIKNETFTISTLSIQEFVYILHKLKFNSEVIASRSNFFSKFIKYYIDKEIITKSINMCESFKKYNIINDVIHYQIALKNCKEIITFDKDYSLFNSSKNFNIKILD